MNIELVAFDSKLIKRLKLRFKNLHQVMFIWTSRASRLLIE